MATGSTGYVTDPSSGIQYDPGTGNTPNGGNISDVSPLTPSGQYGSVQANGGTTQNGAAPGGAAANGLIGALVQIAPASTATLLTAIQQGRRRSSRRYGALSLAPATLRL